MNFLYGLLFVALSCCFLPEKAVAQENKESALAPVGMATRAFVDEGRRNWQGTGPRPLNTVIWYPVAANSHVEPFVTSPATAKFFGDPTFGKFFAEIPVASNAPPLAGAQKRPLLLLSHGATSLGLALMWFGDYFASHGYIVAAVNHHGNTAAEGQLLAQGFLQAWERPEDLTAVLNQLLADPVLGPQIDRNRIGAAGHSAGGATVIQLAGGTFDGMTLGAFCDSPESNGDGTCEPREPIRQAIARVEELKKTDPVVQASFRREKESHRDARIKGVFAMAPAVGRAFTKKSLSAVHIPVLIVIGDADDTTPLATNAGHYAKLIKGAKLTVLPKAGHMIFGGECTALGKEKLDGCRDAAGVDRAAIHHQVAQQALEFFERVWAKQ